MDRARAKKLSLLPENPVLFRNGANLNSSISLNVETNVYLFGKIYF